MTTGEMMFSQYLRQLSALLAAFLFALTAWAASPVVRSDVDTILFLLPDSASATDPRVTVWLDAAAEEGLHVKAITDSQFLALNSPASQYAGLILPDQVHQTASDALVAAVTAYVQNGGKLMLVYDAGSLTAPDASGNSFYASPRSRFSPLAGVDYVLYESYGAYMIGLGNLVALQSSWRTLGVPPGKSMAYPSAPAAADPVQGVTSYYYGFLNYPSFVTQGAYTGTAIITSPNFGLVAGISGYGKGKVLFVNTPLGYLKGYGTDGLLLHGFLRYFAAGMLQFPYLSPLPQGKSGVVVNIHTDCGNSLDDIRQLDQAKFWNSGPFSIDFTAGPDCIAWDDLGGLDVPTNTTTQTWLKYFVGKGHEVGSHGGWIHDFYGLNVTEDNQNTVISGSGAASCSGPVGSKGLPQCTFGDLLVINKKAIEAVSPKKVREYAAPEGNTPKWSVDWMEKNGIVGYYWVGDTGMAPTRGYREGQLFTKKIWAHPLTPYGTAATFEEFSANNISSSEASTWLTGLVDFTVNYRTSRMIYFHEPGVTGSDTGVSYLSAVQAMLNRGKSYGTRFSLYTMAQLSDFLSDRDNATWRVSLLADGNLQVDAASSTALTDKTWVLPKARYAQPVGISNVTVVNDSAANEWLVRAAAGAKSAQFTARPLTPLF